MQTAQPGQVQEVQATFHAPTHARVHEAVTSPPFTICQVSDLLLLERKEVGMQYTGESREGSSLQYAQDQCGNG